jgi:NodT family efflux transporter outer membrane factor (OMF) lipoprotein
LPDSYNGVTSADNSAQLRWCDFFDDPTLIDLINQAIAGNQELKIRNQDVRIANNEILARIGAYLPFLSLGAGASIDKASRFTREGAVEDQLTVAPGKGFPEPLPNFLVAADVSWEIDIWKKLRNARNAAVQRYFATAEGRNYFVTRLIAEVAENYYELLALDSRLQILDATIAIQEQSLQMAQARMQAGRDTSLGVQRFEADVRKNQSEKFIIQQEIIEAENRINFLAGRFPQRVERQLVDYLNLNLHALSVGVPSQLLANRADIRQAERELTAAGLDVLVARARFFPALTLHAGVGYEAFNTKYLFRSPESLIYNAAGDLVAPLVNRAEIKADYMNANARQLQALYEYQRTILNAFTEVINRMAKVENYGRSIALKRQQSEALQAAVSSAMQLFQGARAEYGDVLFAQRDLMEVRMALVETKRQQLVAIVMAYQALGGGGVPTNQLQPPAAGNPNAENIPLEQPLRLRPDGEQIPPPPPAPQQPEVLPPVS